MFFQPSGQLKYLSYILLKAPPPISFHIILFYISFNNDVIVTFCQFDCYYFDLLFKDAVRIAFDRFCVVNAFSYLKMSMKLNIYYISVNVNRILNIN